MNWISRLPNISNFITSHSQVLGRIDFLKKNTQSLQENTWAGVFFNKGAGLQSPFWKLIWERDSSTGAFLWIWQKFWEYLFFRTAPRFYNFSIAKVRHSIYCALFTDLRYLSKSLTNSVNLVSLESGYQAEHHFLLFL